MRLIEVIVLATAALVCAFAPACAEKRAALVIDNSFYQHVGRLLNPVSDAAAMAALFNAARFDVVETHKDLGIAAMRRAIRDFADKAPGSDIAVICFAGHGIEVDGVNYLIPVDAALASDFDVKDETISLDRALKAIETTRRLRLAGGQATVSPPAVSGAAQAWRDIQNTTSLAVLDDYIRQYGDVPIYGTQARVRREELAKSQVAVTGAGSLA